MRVQHGRRQLFILAGMAILAACSSNPKVFPGSISGTVTLTGASSSAQVQVTLSGSSSGTATTDAGGHYTFSSLAAGSYLVTATAASTSPALVSTPVTVQAGPVTAPALTLTALGSIKGTATLGAATGDAGITVSVAGTSISAVTDDAGSFTLSAVPAGTATIIASFAHYTSATAMVAVPYNQTAMAMPLALSPSVAPGLITGTVTVSGGSDLSGVVLTLSGPTSGTATTDMTGAYSFSGLPAGNYSVTAVARSTVENIQTVQVTVGMEQVAAPAIAFTGLGSVSGTATLGAATGNGGIVVAAAGTSAVTVTSDSGAYSLASVPAGQATIVASYPGHSSASSTVTVSWGKTAMTPALTLGPASAPGGITGLVQLGTVSPLPALTVTVTGPQTAAGVTDTTGAYSFANLPAGNYTVTVAAPSTREGTLSTSVTVGTSVATSPMLSFTPLGAITGVATLGAATGNAGIMIAVPGTSVFALTDDAGNYQLPGVPAGSQSVIASFPGYTSGQTSVTVPYAASVTATAISLALAVAPGSIAGSVTFSGQPAPAGIVVTLVGPQGGATTTDASGSFTFTGLPDGSYQVQATAASTLEGTVSTTVTVAQGGAATASSLAFTAQGSIQGQATLGQATGNAGITVAVPSAGIQTITDDAGNFLLRGVPVGAQTVTATYPGYVAGNASGLMVAYAQTVTAAPITLSRSTFAGSITGTVSVSGATIDSGFVATLTGPTGAVALTDDTGAYTFSGLPDGTYSISASVPSTLEGSLQTTVTITGGQPATAAALSFTGLGTVTGTVTLGSQNTGNGGIIVAIAGTSLTTTTQDDGSYTLTNVPVGAQSVLASFSGYGSGKVTATVPYRASVTATAMSLSKATYSGGISGAVVLSGTPGQDGLTVTLSGPQGGVAMTSGGVYTFTSLPDGTYTVTASVPSTLELAQSIQVTVSGGVVAMAPALNFTAVGTISGTVTLQGQSDSAGIIVSVPSLGLSTVTSTTGTFLIKNVPVGSQSLLAFMPGFISGTAAATVTYNANAAVAPFVLQPNPQTASTISLTGKALLFDQASSAGTTVSVVGSNPLLSATTAADGTYSIQNVPVGVVTLKFSNPNGVGYAETLQGVTAGQDTTGTIVGNVLQGSGTQTYVLANAPMYVPKGNRIDPGYFGIPQVTPDGTKALISVPSSTGGTNWELAPLNGSAPSVYVSSSQYGPSYNLFSSDGSQLAYAVYNGANGFNLYSYPTAGGSATTLATGIVGLWSMWAAGSHVVWATNISSSGTNTLTIYSVPFTGGTPTTLFSATTNNWNILVTADGSHVVYSYYASTATPATYYVYSVPTAGGTPTLLTSNPNYAWLQWLSGDSRYAIIYAYNGSGYDNYYSVPVSGGSVTDLQVNPNSGLYGLWNPTAHSDYLVYSQYNGSNYGMYSAPLGGGTPTQFAVWSSGYPNSMTFSPDGSHQCYVPPVSPYALWCATMSGASATAVGGSDSGPQVFFTTNGQYVAWTNATALQSSAVSGGTPRTLVPSGFNSAAAIDATHLAVLYTPSGSVSTLASFDLTTGTPTVLATNIAGNFQLSPDGTRIAYISAANNYLFSMPSLGGTATPISNFAQSGNFLWTATAKELLFVRNGTPPPYNFQNGLYAITTP